MEADGEAGRQSLRCPEEQSLGQDEQGGDKLRHPERQVLHRMQIPTENSGHRVVPGDCGEGKEGGEGAHPGPESEKQEGRLCPGEAEGLIDMRILRVFPRRTSLTPKDALVVIGRPELWKREVGEVHISCVFTWDRGYCEELRKEWSQYYPVVKIGGPAYGLDGNGFIPGRYVRAGVTFTSRGCNFSCPWCLIPKMEGTFRTLRDIAPGNVIQDNNILLANADHLAKVFSMLKTQRAIRFSGGLDVRLLKDWYIEELRGLRIKELWLALDSWDTQRQFKNAVERLKRAGFYRNQIRCYVLAGFGEPTRESEGRLRFAYECGALPFVQLYQPPLPVKRMAGERSRKDNLFIRKWSRPAVVKSVMEG